MKKFNLQVKDYIQILTLFVNQKGLPREWFMSPDHIAIKAADAKDFEALIEEFRPHSRRISCIDMDSRRLAVALMNKSIPMGAFGKVELVEIMEPRPDKLGDDVVGFEHMEFYYPYLERVQEELQRRGLKDGIKLQRNPAHSWVNIVLNDQGQELKLNDNSLAVIVRQELEPGMSYLL
jgi:predicted metalloenzyme YecM